MPINTKVNHNVINPTVADREAVKIIVIVVKTNAIMPCNHHFYIQPFLLQLQ